jgi:hypothetical protein
MGDYGSLADSSFCPTGTRESDVGSLYLIEKFAGCDGVFCGVEVRMPVFEL